MRAHWRLDWMHFSLVVKVQRIKMSGEDLLWKVVLLEWMDPFERFVSGEGKCEVCLKYVKIKQSNLSERRPSLTDHQS
jgi:hypothetical protein